MSDLAVYESAVPNLFGAPEPEQVIERATAVATPLADVIRRQRLAVTIQGREHVRVEGWTLLGSMLGVFPVCEWTRKLEDGWEARVVATTRDGGVVGAAEAECLRSERTWANRDDYALRSMAQTRATSKAMRQPLGFVMTLAGFEATPAEEMPAQADREPAQPAPSRGGISEAQHKKIEALLNTLGRDRETFKTELGVGSLSDLTKAQASQVIDRLVAEEQASDIPF